jgi:hypothetical protein
MAERLGEALLDIDTDDRKFNQGVDRAERRATGLGRTLDETSRRAGQLGKALAVAAGAAGAAFFGAGIAGAVRRLEELRKSSAQVDQALKNSGNTARTSAKEIDTWANALEERTGRAAEEVMDVSANLASFGFGREEFYRAIELGDDMAAAWGGDLRQNLEGLARALDDPINGMAMLSKRGIKLTQEQKDMAAAFLDAGDKVSAQGVVFDALEAQVKGVAEAGFGGLTKAMATAQKAWEDAFEDLVTGTGDAEDLRDSLVGLMDTLSSPDFIEAVMGFGTLIVNMIKGIADVATAAGNAVRDLRDFFSDDEAMSEAGIRNTIAGNEVTIASLRTRHRASTSREEKTDLANQAEVLMQRNDALAAELERRAALQPPTGPGAPPGGGIGDGGGGDGGGSTKKQSDALKALIADLEHEQRIIALSALDQEVMNAVRRAGVDVMSAEGLEIRRLITETAEHRGQLEQMEEAYDMVGDVGRTALMGLVDAMKDGKVEGNELLGILGNVLSMAGQFFLNQGMSGFGGGPGKGIASLFAGFFADGGLIPNGSFGIVGEAGPEPVIGTPRGAQVLPHSSLADVMGGGQGGSLQVNINGSGLSQSELTQAIADAIDRFDRFRLPGRVAAINADPLASGN